MLECLRRVESNQLIVMQVSFEGEPLPIPFTAGHVCDDESLSFIGNNSQKPQQNGEWGTPGPQQLTLISTAEFAEREFNCNPKGYRRKAEEKLLGSLGRLLKVDVWQYKPQINRINHWEDGLPSNTPPASKGCLFDAKEGLGWCGDFCVAPGVEGAARSGAAMAEVLASFHGQKDFCGDGLLPMDVDWVSIGTASGFGVVDIGAFPGVPSRCTHTPTTCPPRLEAMTRPRHILVTWAPQKDTTARARTSKARAAKVKAKAARVKEAFGRESEAPMARKRQRFRAHCLTLSEKLLFVQELWATIFPHRDCIGRCTEAQDGLVDFGRCLKVYSCYTPKD
ncbi:unnamed protein product [Symbiodinium sp. CCMP2592]|nr:unnamed protein product [Symbiodinium sp. CCMP2592]